MPELMPFAVDRADVTPYYEALSAVLDARGPALAPFTTGEAPPDLPPLPGDAPEDLALVVSTSGSTGTPKRAMLTRSALVASAMATHDRLGGAGTWLLPLPPAHIAGTQVLVRSVVAGTTPIVMDEWSLEKFVKATALVARNAPPFSPIYTSLVPAQLHDVLGDSAALSAARRYRAILVGGAATSPSLLQEALAHGLKIVRTYGSSETAGGCVYDGRPLDDVSIEIFDKDIDGVGHIALGGPTVAAGYLAQPELTRSHFVELDGKRYFRTGDLGRLDGEELSVIGRSDDVIVSNGYKISPSIVEEAVRSVSGISDVLCVALPDERRGQCVAIAVVRASDPKASLSVEQLTNEILDACVRALPPYAIPRRIAMLTQLPTRGIGKPDREAIARYDDWRSLRPASRRRLTED